MGIFGKLFGRKKDDLGLDLDRPAYKPLGAADMGLPELETPTMPPTAESQRELSGELSPFPPQYPQQNFEEPEVSPLRNYQPRSFAPQQQMQQPSLTARDVELILSKLDAIRSALNNVEMRLARLEKIAGVEKDDKGYRW